MSRDRADVVAIRRSNADPARLVRELALRVGGRTAIGVLVQCPRSDHNDSTASCHVFRAKDGTVGVFCHGCQWSADAIGLVAEVRGLDFRGACAALGGPLAADPSAPAPYVAEAPPQAVSDDDFDRIASAILEACPLAGDTLEYVKSRGIEVQALEAGLGALPADRAGRSRVRGAAIAAAGLDAWRACGLATDDGEDFRAPYHRLLIPYRAPGVDGTIITLQRRRIDQGGEPRYVFPLGRPAPRWPFGGEDIELADDDTAIVFCEGVIDALTLRRCYRADGLNRIVLSIPSVSTWIPAWARLAAGRLAIIATDADKAGDKVAATMAGDLFDAGALAVQRAKPATSAKDWTAQEAHA